MRRIVILFVILALCAASLAALWIFRGREISLLIDRYWRVEVQAVPIHAIAYEGNGTGGILIFNGVSLSLNVSPGISLSVGSTKDNQLALASNGKVFPFAPLAAGEGIAAVPPSTDQASLVTRRSALSWPTPFDPNFMTGPSPSWKRHIYYEVCWKKSSGANLQMLWRYEQSFYGKQVYPDNGWSSGFGVHEGSTGLIRLEINQ
jgi:hypothetical protein